MKRLIIILSLLVSQASCQCDSSYNRIVFLDIHAQPASCIVQGETYIAVSYAVEPNSDQDSCSIWMNIEDQYGSPVSDFTGALTATGCCAYWDTFGTDVRAYTQPPNYFGWGWTLWGRFLRWNTLGVQIYAVTPGPWIITAVDTTYGLANCVHYDTLIVPPCSVLTPAPVVAPAPEPVIERKEYEWYEYGSMRRVFPPEFMKLYRKVNASDGSGKWTLIVE